MSDGVVNPFLVFRQEFKGRPMSIREVSKLLGVAESTYLRTEQGLYNDIPPVLLRAISDHVTSPAVVCANYERSQISQRTATYRDGKVIQHYRDLLAIEVSEFPEANPFILWRQNINGFKTRLAFCKAVCLHPSTVKRVEDGVAESISRDIVDAMLFCGVDLNPLESEYRIWQKLRKLPNKPTL